MRRLAHKSDYELLNAIPRFRMTEDDALADTIVHLDEIRHRKLHLKGGYRSLYTFLREKYNFSSTRSYLRKAVAEAYALEPRVEGAIRENQICPTYLKMGMVAIRRENKRRRENGEPKLLLIDRCRLINAILDTREARRTIARFFPKLKPDYNKEVPITAELTEYTMAATEEEVAKIKRVKELLSTKVVDGNWHDVVFEMVEITLKKLDPARKPKRRPNTEETTKQRAHLSVGIDRALDDRCDGQCEYTCEETGHRCTERYDIQTDHVIPVALGGTDSFRNLRKLCRAHNLYAAWTHGLDRPDFSP